VNGRGRGGEGGRPPVAYAQQEPEMVAALAVLEGPVEPALVAQRKEGSTQSDNVAGRVTDVEREMGRQLSTQLARQDGKSRRRNRQQAC